MSQNRVLVVYASTHGQTAKIAERVAGELRDGGLSVTLRDVADPADVAEFDAVVVGGSIHAGKHQKDLVAWIDAHGDVLAARPSAFFSVSLTAADGSDEARAATRAMIDAVLAEAGWTPALTQAFAGALLFKEYNLPTRVMMRLIARRIEQQTGAPVDVHADTEYTDWEAVDGFAAAFAGVVEGAGAQLVS